MRDQQQHLDHVEGGVPGEQCWRLRHQVGGAQLEMEQVGEACVIAGGVVTAEGAADRIAGLVWTP